MDKFFRLNKNIDKNLFNNFKVFLEKAIYKNIKYIFIMFDCRGGDISYAGKIINLMNESKIKFIGVAVKKIDSATLPIFLSCQIKFGYEEASSLIHRVIKVDKNISDIDLKTAENQVFKFISEKLFIPEKEVYLMADRNTVIDKHHKFGKKIFSNFE